MHPEGNPLSHSKKMQADIRALIHAYGVEDRISLSQIVVGYASHGMKHLANVRAFLTLTRPPADNPSGVLGPYEGQSDSFREAYKEMEGWIRLTLARQQTAKDAEIDRVREAFATYRSAR